MLTLHQTVKLIGHDALVLKERPAMDQSSDNMKPSGKPDTLTP